MAHLQFTENTYKKKEAKPMANRQVNQKVREARKMFNDRLTLRNTVISDKSRSPSDTQRHMGKRDENKRYERLNKYKTATATWDID